MDEFHFSEFDPSPDEVEQSFGISNFSGLVIASGQRSIMSQIPHLYEISWTLQDFAFDDGVSISVDDGDGIDSGVGVAGGEENDWKYEERLEKEFKECCIQIVSKKSGPA